MKAAIYNRYGGPDVIEIKDIDTPKPTRDQVLIKIHACSVNPVDWKVVKGNLKMITGYKFPKYIGIEGSGVIEETGENVTGLSKGQRVFAGLDYHGGACAEFVCTTADRVMPISNNISFEEACTMAIAGITALQGLRDKGNLKSGMDVLINGASGGVGTYAVQIAKTFGAYVTAVCSEGNSQLVKSLGADEFIDYHKEDFTKSDKQYDIVFDAVGNCNFWQVKRVMKKKAVYVNISPSFGLFLSSFISRLYPGKKSKAYMIKPIMKDLAEVMNLISSKKIKVIIDRIFPFEETWKAFEYSSSERAKGKLVIRIR
jgi:NADPH:quinone reductase-like Zn-dependent oxidoreductase